MATANPTTNDGAARALSTLYEASDLVKVLGEYSWEFSPATSTREWSGRVAAQNTMIGEISRRLNAAIAQLDGAVPHPADESGQAKAPTDQSEPASEPAALQRLYDLQCHLESIRSVSELVSIASENDPQFDGFCDVVRREVEGVRNGLDDLITPLRDLQHTGATSLAETRRRLEAACAGMTAEECSQRLRAHLINVSHDLAADDSEDPFIVTETCTLKGLRCMVAEQELLQSALPDYEPTDIYRKAMS